MCPFQEVYDVRISSIFILPATSHRLKVRSFRLIFVMPLRAGLTITFPVSVRIKRRFKKFSPGQLDDLRFLFVELYPQFGTKAADLLQTMLQMFFALMNKIPVVHVPTVCLYAQLLLDVVVELVLGT